MLVCTTLFLAVVSGSRFPTFTTAFESKRSSRPFPGHAAAMADVYAEETCNLAGDGVVASFFRPTGRDAFHLSWIGCGEERFASTGAENEFVLPAVTCHDLLMRFTGPLSQLAVKFRSACFTMNKVAHSTETDGIFGGAPEAAAFAWWRMNERAVPQGIRRPDGSCLISAPAMKSLVTGPDSIATLSCLNRFPAWRSTFYAKTGSECPRVDIQLLCDVFHDLHHVAYISFFMDPVPHMRVARCTIHGTRSSAQVELLMHPGGVWKLESLTCPVTEQVDGLAVLDSKSFPLGDLDDARFSFINRLLGRFNARLIRNESLDDQCKRLSVHAHSGLLFSKLCS